MDQPPPSSISITHDVVLPFIAHCSLHAPSPQTACRTSHVCVAYGISACSGLQSAAVTRKGRASKARTERCMVIKASKVVRAVSKRAALFVYTCEFPPGWRACLPVVGLTVSGPVFTAGALMLQLGTTWVGDIFITHSA